MKTKFLKQSKNTMVNELAEEVAVIELPKKLVNERRMERHLRSIFRQMSIYLKVHVEEYGVLPNFMSFKQDLDELIEKDYRTTSRTFKSVLRKELGLGRVYSSEINQRIDDFITKQTQDSSGFILKTTNKEAKKLYERAVQDAALFGIELDNEQLAKKVSSDFSKKNRIRSRTIALTEIQRASETSKNIEATVLSEKKIINDLKRWDAILDRRTRLFHAEADGKVIPLNKPFEVAGEFLMYPGDRSLGASAKNLINCRCSVQYLKLEEEE